MRGVGRSAVGWLVAILLIAASMSLGALDAQLGSQPGQAPPLEPGTGAISGTVVDALTGRPLAGAVVYVGITGRGAVGQISRQLTDAKGRFVFVNLPAHDQFFINASRFGYENGGYGFTPIRNAPTRIRLGEGEWFKDARIALWRPAAIGGRVVDERGEPVVGVPVRLLAKILVGGRPQTAAGPFATTDDRGVYRIAGLKPGTYFVQVPSVQSSLPAGVEPEDWRVSSGGPSMPRFTLDTPGAHRQVVGDYALAPAAGTRPRVYPITYHPSARRTAEAVPVELALGDDRSNVDVVLAAVPAAAIRGVVQGPPEALAGLMLRLVPEGAEDMGLGSEAATSVLDANGRFAFLSVPAGAYTIDARRTAVEFQSGNSTLGSTPPLPPGFAVNSMSSSSVASAPPGTTITMRRPAGAGSYWALVPVTVGARDVDGVTVTMQRGATLTGRYVFEGLPEPPANAQFMHVVAEPADGNVTYGLPSSSFGASPSAPFTVEGLLPGRYTLRVTGQGSRVVKSIMWNGEDHTYKGFDGSTGRDFEGVVITFTDKGPQLSGTLRRSTADAASRSIALAFPVESEQWSGYGLTPSRIRTAVADTSGAFRFAQLPAGEYFVVGLEEDDMYAWQDPKFLAAAQGQAVRVTLEWGEVKTQDLRVVKVR